MKDFYDVAIIADRFPFAGSVLATAVERTLRRRGIVISSLGDSTVLTEKFGGDSDKQLQWRSFLNRTQLADIAPEFAVVAERIRRFLQPVGMALALNKPFLRTWPPGGPWTKRNSSRKSSTSAHSPRPLSTDPCSE